MDSSLNSDDMKNLAILYQEYKKYVAEADPSTTASNGNVVQSSASTATIGEDHLQPSSSFKEARSRQKLSLTRNRGQYTGTRQTTFRVDGTSSSTSKRKWVSHETDTATLYEYEKTAKRRKEDSSSTVSKTTSVPAISYEGLHTLEDKLLGKSTEDDTKWEPKNIYNITTFPGRMINKITFKQHYCLLDFTNCQTYLATYDEILSILIDCKPATLVLIISEMTRYSMHRDFLSDAFFYRTFENFWLPNTAVVISGNWCSNPLTAFVSTFPQNFQFFKMQDFTIHVAGRLHWLFPVNGSHLLGLKQLLFDCRLTDNKNYYPNVWHVANYFKFRNMNRLFLNVKNFTTREMAEKSFELLERSTCSGATVTILMDQFIDNRLFRWLEEWDFKYVGETYYPEPPTGNRNRLWAYCTFNCKFHGRLFTFGFRWWHTVMKKTPYKC